MLNIIGLERLSIGPIDLRLKAGEIVALSGPSGTGKSLMLRAIADLDMAKGEFYLAGEERRSMSAPLWRRQVMYVPAHSGWWEDTVEPHFQNAQRTRVIDILHHLGLESTALGWRVANLSTGERQRLALARAVALSPKVLLLDEPTSSLDAKNVQRVESLLQAQARAGVAILLITHDTTQAARLAQRTLLLEGGHIQ